MKNGIAVGIGIGVLLVVVVLAAYSFGQASIRSSSVSQPQIATTSTQTSLNGGVTKKTSQSVEASQPSVDQTQSTSFLNASGNLSSLFIARIEPSVVEINCYSYDDSIESSGSGISLMKKTGANVIYTNYHVYAGAIVNGHVPTCYAVFPQTPNFTFNSSYGDYQLTLSNYLYKPGNYVDAALFTVGAPLPSTTALNSIPVMGTYIKKFFCDANTQVDVGDSVTIFGYPNSGNLLGISETVTTGIISGILPGPIYKTDAPIDHGNSGGYAVLNKDGCGLGIPTLGESGLTAGIGYVQSYALVAAQ